MPNTSVLFDGHIPTLTGLDGDVWASQLLTLQAAGHRSKDEHLYDVNITVKFSTKHTMAWVGVTLFNCSQWGASVTRIKVYGVSDDSSSQVLKNDYGYHMNVPYNTFKSSCDNLVTVYIPLFFFENRYSTFWLLFGVNRYHHWVHLAELAFYIHQVDTRINHPPTSPPTPTTAGAAIMTIGKCNSYTSSRCVTLECTHS